MRATASARKMRDRRVERTAEETEACVSPSPTTLFMLLRIFESPFAVRRANRTPLSYSLSVPVAHWVQSTQFYR